jgi:predicted ATPase
MLGFADQARVASEETENNARRRGHPFDLAFALTLGAEIYDFLGDPGALLRRSEEAERIGREYGLSLLAEITHGIAWLRSGRVAEGTARLGQAIERLKQTGHRVWISYLEAVQAQGLALSGKLERAWSLIEQAVAQSEVSEERSHYPEILRLRGWLLIQRGEFGPAESTLRKAIEAARAQVAKSWELRAATTLARMLADQGRRTEGLAVLKPVLESLEEGQNTSDFLESRRLLDELSHSKA